MEYCFTLENIDLVLTADVLRNLATVAGAIIAAWALGTWKRQLRGSHKYNVALKALSAAYHIGEALQAVRNPMLYLKKEEVDAGKWVQEEQRIYDERLKYVDQKWAEVSPSILEAQILWGADAKKCFDSLRKCTGSLKASIWMHFWLKGVYAPSAAHIDNNPERIADNNRVVYRLSEDVNEDEFSRKVQTAVEQVENQFRPKMGG